MRFENWSCAIGVVGIIARNFHILINYFSLIYLNYWPRRYSSYCNKNFNSKRCTTWETIYMHEYFLSFCCVVEVRTLYIRSFYLISSIINTCAIYKSNLNILESGKKKIHGVFIVSSVIECGIVCWEFIIANRLSCEFVIHCRSRLRWGLCDGKNFWWSTLLCK